MPESETATSATANEGNTQATGETVKDTAAKQVDSTPTPPPQSSSTSVSGQEAQKTDVNGNNGGGNVHSNQVGLTWYPQYPAQQMWTNQQGDQGQQQGQQTGFAGVGERQPLAAGTQQRRSIDGNMAAGSGAPYMVKPPQPGMEISQDQEINDLAAIWSRVQASQNPFVAGGGTSDNLFHRRSSTTPYKAPWEANKPPGQQQQMQGQGHQMGNMGNMYMTQPDRFRLGQGQQRRYSLSPNLNSGDGYGDSMGIMRRGQQFVGRNLAPGPTGAPDPMPMRRHSVAGPLYHAPGRFLSEAFSTLHIDDNAVSQSRENGVPMGYSSLLEDFEELLDQDSRRPSVSSSSEVGKGIALHSLPHDTKLYIVEFKAGRSDIFYIAEDDDVTVKKGDLVIVEADRGRDLGKVINDSITPYQIHMLQAQHSEALNDLHRVNREIHPKRIYRLAEPPEVAMLVTKSQDESKGLSVCQTKVRQKNLAMEVVDAEYQWDRRKLTFYFVADRRIDFRELVRDLFKIYKTRIWMCAVNPVVEQLTHQLQKQSMQGMQQPMQQPMQQQMQMPAMMGKEKQY